MSENYSYNFLEGNPGWRMKKNVTEKWRRKVCRHEKACPFLLLNTHLYRYVIVPCETNASEEIKK